jgi:hypothetical protein
MSPARRPILAESLANALPRGERAANHLPAAVPRSASEFDPVERAGYQASAFI